MKRDPKTYSEAMNDWKLQEAQRSFMGKFRSSIFHPRYNATWPEKLFGYLVRLVLFAIVAFVGIFYYARLQSRSKGYRSHLAEMFAGYYKGTQAEMGAVVWPLLNNNISIKSLNMAGTEDSFYHRIEGRSIGMELGLQFLSDSWEFERLNIHELDVDLKSGGVGNGAPKSSPSYKKIEPVAPNRVVVPQRSTSSVHPLETRLLTAGFGLKPGLSSLTVGSYHVGSLNCNWGSSQTNIGSIKGANSYIVPKNREQQKWSLTCNSGTVSQNWIRDAVIEKFQVDVSPDNVEIVTGSTLLIGKAGRMTLQGQISVEELPQLDLDVTLKSVDLRDFCPPSMTKFFMGTVDAKGKITGTSNHESGIKTSLRCNLVAPTKSKTDSKNELNSNLIAHITELRMLNAIYKCTQERGFMQMRFSEGSFSMETGSQTMTLRDIDLISPLGRMRGEVTCEEVMEDRPNARAGEPTKVPGFLFTGDLLIGIKPELAKNMPQKVKDVVLEPQMADGLNWIRISFRKDTGAELTNAKANEMERLLRESWSETPIPPTATPAAPEVK
jgi:hypothetical protein